MTQASTDLVSLVFPVNVLSCPSKSNLGRYVEPGLLDRLKRREWTAQELVFRAEEQHLRSLARNHLAFDCEVVPLVADVLSDFFFQYVDDLRHDRAIPSYLRTMTIRRAHRCNERRNRDRDIHNEEHLEAWTHDPIEAVDAGRWLPLLHECMNTLSQREQQVLKLHFGRELTLGQVGVEVGVSKQAVAKIIRKSVDRLRCRLAALRGGIGLANC